MKSKKAINSYIEEVFHDQGHIYMQPLEPKTTDNVTIRIRVKEVTLLLRQYCIRLMLMKL